MKLSKRRQSKQVPSLPSSPEPVQEDQRLSLDHALELFLLAQQAINNSKATRQDYKYVIGLFLRYVQETLHYTLVEEITEQDIIGWLAYLQGVTTTRGRPYSSRSIETYNRDVAVFFMWLARHKHINVNPMAQVERPKVEKALIRVFSEEELKRMDAACDRAVRGKSLTEDERKALSARDRAFLWMLLSTGIRLSEACGLLFSDVDWKEEMIYIRGKGAKERRIPFGKIAKQHLDTYVRYWRGTSMKDIQPDEHVFLNAFGNPLNPLPARQIFRRLKEIAEITDKRVSPHTCRHWFAVNAIKNGMPTVILKNILGHENWDMIEVYVRLAEQDVKQSYTRFSPVDGLEMHKNPKGKRTELRNWRQSRKKEGQGN